jgi:hypothetical protein
MRGDLERGGLAVRRGRQDAGTGFVVASPMPFIGSGLSKVPPTLKHIQRTPLEPLPESGSALGSDPAGIGPAGMSDQPPNGGR